MLQWPCALWSCRHSVSDVYAVNAGPNGIQCLFVIPLQVSLVMVALCLFVFLLVIGGKSSSPSTMKYSFSRHVFANLSTMMIIIITSHFNGTQCTKSDQKRR